MRAIGIQSVDMESARTESLRTVESQLELLELALHALRHGSPHVTDEYIETVIAAQNKHLASLRDQCPFISLPSSLTFGLHGTLRGAVLSARWAVKG